jgi:site-specific recombinase XerD
MTRTNAENERCKTEFLDFLKEAYGRDEATLDRVAKSIARFEESTGRKDFRRFHRQQAVAFKAKLAIARNARTGESLSKATILATLSDLRSFFLWLAREPGFKSHIHYRDADYFNLSGKDVAIARAPREKRVPSLKQAQRVLRTMPADTLIQRRDRALFAFAMITGARIRALTSFRLKHLDVETGSVNQDARLVRTKGSKSFVTFFMPVDDDAPAIVAAWVRELTDEHGWSPNDPLFPATEMGLGADGSFQAKGLTRRCWSGSQPIRDIYSRAFAGAALPYFNPHSLRDMLVHHAMSLGLGADEMKAWSQNLGHADVLTTFTSYGQIPTHRQGDLIRKSGDRNGASGITTEEIAAMKAFVGRIAASDLGG